MSPLPKLAARIRRYSAGSDNLRRKNVAAGRFIDHLDHVLLNGAAGRTICWDSVDRYTAPSRLHSGQSKPNKEIAFQASMSPPLNMFLVCVGCDGNQANCTNH